MSEQQKTVIVDGNEAAASVAYRLSEVIAIYPITPSSPMAESADQWAAEGKTNIWGAVPIIEELQSEGGAAGALHGALQAGAFGTTFTASQGLLLMVPNMFKIAGELTPATMHVTARTIATHALSIFGDHSDVMACRSTGWAMLASNSVQECADLALVSQIATLESRVPFMHFFDGFRTSHEASKIHPISDEAIRALLDDKHIVEFRQQALSPDRPILRGTAQNPDVFFQAREACTPYYDATPKIVQGVMDRMAKLTGRAYHLFDYYGAADADRVIILMGSGAETAEEAVDALNKQGAKLGLIKVRLYRPFDASAFLGALPATVKSIAVLDRTKEPGSAGEPLYQDVLTVLAENASKFKTMPTVVGGRYGLSSKEFTPAMVKGIFDELAKPAPKNHFTIGIDDDVSHSSLSYDPSFSTEDDKTVRALFYGLGSDGTVGANKNSIKIIGSETPNYAQGYFVYDSKKSGSMTTSHLRFGPNPIRSTYLITRASFIACHNFSFLEKINVLEAAVPNTVFLLNSPFAANEVWDKLPQTIQKEMLDKNIQFYVIDGYKVARDAGMGGRTNTIMQTCFFAISGVLPKDEAIAQIKKSIQKTYGKRGEAIVQKNFAAVDAALAHLHKVELPKAATSGFDIVPSLEANEQTKGFVSDVLGAIAAGKGDLLPVSAIPAGGTFPTGTAQWEKRNIAQFIPEWDKDLCIQCGKCVMVCPHAVLRAKVYSPDQLKDAPATFKSAKAKWKGMEDQLYTLQVAPEDCTGCTVCVEVCPAKSKSDASHKAINMVAQEPLRVEERKNWEFFLNLPEVDRNKLSHGQVKDLQLLQPLFEFSGACAGCGETPYVKLMTQLFGDRLYIANATGCSSIYGGNLPTTPYTTNPQGRGPTWSNSLFEDNAEFGFGMRLALDQQKEFAETLLKRQASVVGDDLVSALLTSPQNTEVEINAQRDRVKALRESLAGKYVDSTDARNLTAIADALVRKSVWILGGDGWAYDIGFGGLDHVLGTGKNINILVLDTEVYSNTGGQMSKATPRGAVAKFAAKGKTSSKKDLAMEAVAYGYVYVARVSMGANDSHTVKAFQEAEAHDGPSIIIAYSACIAHGYDLAYSLEQEKLAVQSGYWPLMRYNPSLRDQGKNPFLLDSKAPTIRLKDYAYREARYTMLARSNPQLAEEMLALAQDDVERQWRVYSSRAAMPGRAETPNIAPPEVKAPAQ